MTDMANYVQFDTLKDGDVAIIFRGDGTVALTHHIAEVRDSGQVTAQTAPGFLMALAALISVEDGEQYDKNISEAGRRLSAITFAGSSGRVQ